MNGEASPAFLLVNRVEVISECCDACGNGFASNPAGEKALIASVGSQNRVLRFCSPCGDNINSRIQSEEARARYVWDWAIPLKDGRGLTHNG